MYAIRSYYVMCDFGSDTAREAIRSFRPEVVNHHAAQINVRASVADPGFDAQVNILGTIRLLEACRQYGVRKFLFASSGGAGYGEQESFPADESHPLQPVSPYGAAKMSVELYLGFYRAQYGLDSPSLRYANVYGPVITSYSIHYTKLYETLPSPMITGSPEQRWYSLWMTASRNNFV